MVPFVPHLASECLSQLNCKDINKLPDIDEKFFKFENKFSRSN